MAMIWRQFVALGTEIMIMADIDGGKSLILDRAEQEVVAFEQRFSRFLKNSELSYLNNSSDAWYRVSPMMLNLLKAAKDYFTITDGVFDPSILNNLESLGYNQSFDKINNPSDSSSSTSIEIDIVTPTSFKDLIIENEKVFWPKALRIDLGGIGKGYLVDYLSNYLFAEVGSYCLSAGGDLIVKGNEEGKIGWEIKIQDPYNSNSDILTLQTSGEKLAVATSGIFKRQGIREGNHWHHLINPLTSTPVNNNILAVTAIADTAIAADIFAKTILLLGEEKGRQFIDRQPLAAGILFSKLGEIIYSKKVKNYSIKAIKN